MKKILPKHKFLLFLLFFVFLLRLPSLFEPYWYGDEGIYLTLGNAFRQGLVFYRDIHDNKPPLLYLLAAIAGNLFWFRFLLLAWSMMTVFFFFKLAQKFLGETKWAKLAAVLMAFFSSIPLLEGNIANAEIFMILPILLGVLLFFQTQKPNPKTFLIIGALFSLATLFKVPAGFDFAALLFFLIFFRFKLKEITNWLILLLGFVTPILFTIIYYALNSSLNQYLTAAFYQNIPYLSSWQTGQHSGGPGSEIILRGLLLIVLLGILWIFRKKWSENFSFISVWFLFTLFAAALSGRPYPHYLIQVLAPSVLLLTSLFAIKSSLSKIAAASLLSLFLFTTVYLRFWAYPTLAYYQNFFLFTLGQKDKDAYFAGLNPKVPQTYKLAQFLTTHTYPDERVFIWGDSPNLYALSRRLPPGRYTTSYHIIDFAGYRETIEALEKTPPRFIIDLQDESRPFPELSQFLRENYLLIAGVDKAQIYRRLSVKMI